MIFAALKTLENLFKERVTPKEVLYSLQKEIGAAEPDHRLFHAFFSLYLTCLLHHSWCHLIVFRKERRTLVLLPAVHELDEEKTLRDTAYSSLSHPSIICSTQTSMPHCQPDPAESLGAPRPETRHSAGILLPQDNAMRPLCVCVCVCGGRADHTGSEKWGCGSHSCGAEADLRRLNV